MYIANLFRFSVLAVMLSLSIQAAVKEVDSFVIDTNHASRDDKGYYVYEHHFKISFKPGTIKPQVLIPGAGESVQGVYPFIKQLSFSATNIKDNKLYGWTVPIKDETQNKGLNCRVLGGETVCQGFYSEEGKFTVDRGTENLLTITISDDNYSRSLDPTRDQYTYNVVISVKNEEPLKYYELSFQGEDKQKKYIDKVAFGSDEYRLKPSQQQAQSNIKVNTAFGNEAILFVDQPNFKVFPPAYVNEGGVNKYSTAEFALQFDSEQPHSGMFISVNYKDGTTQSFFTPFNPNGEAAMLRDNPQSYFGCDKDPKNIRSLSCTLNPDQNKYKGRLSFDSDKPVNSSMIAFYKGDPAKGKDQGTYLSIHQFQMGSFNQVVDKMILKEYARQGGNSVIEFDYSKAQEIKK